MIFFGDPNPAPEAISQLAMAGDSITIAAVARPMQSFGRGAGEPWITLDIETKDGRPEEVDHWMRTFFSPPAHYETAEAIGKCYLRIREERRKKRALLDGSLIVIVSVRTPRGLYALQTLRPQAPAIDAATGGTIIGFETGRQMLVALRQGLDELSAPDTVFAGHNILSFDLPKLRFAYVKAGLQLPRALAADRQPVYDTMRQFGGRFSQQENPFIALSTILDLFGLPNHKGEIDGSKVQEYIAAGRFDELFTYALKDAEIEARAYLAMTGQLPDQPEAAGA